MIRIAITGRPGVGKSTVIAKVVEKLDANVSGIQCGEIRSEEKRVGFKIQDLATGRAGILSHVECSGPAVGKYYVNLADLDGIGTNAVKKAPNCDLLVIDEIGPMELKSQHFVSAVEHVLDSDRDMLVVLHYSSRHPLSCRIREEFRIIAVNEQNRDGLAEIITACLG
ncbi:MAG: NTPase [ANME-2 cluster archaeon]|nr:NTPase [ANME-2 cluster archaeon]MBC2700315.1 NTPase [ANME-2 cluster archaeon]MBC2706145.1 NTPase [ANME-2 cluster archaeon]MBC2748417.1 NTPase [ANME-2 cluster archaeon]MBC2761858.1 NTPase [ANME-2 cluster archaeon]